MDRNDQITCGVTIVVYATRTVNGYDGLRYGSLFYRDADKVVVDKNLKHEEEKIHFRGHCP